MIEREKLEKLDSKKLIDVAKNYKQYGYSEEVREMAFTVLESRGVKKEDLDFFRTLENSTNFQAEQGFQDYKRNSTIAFLLYLMFLLSMIAIPLAAFQSSTLKTVVDVISWGLLLFYFVFLIKSFIDQGHFFDALGKPKEAQSALVFLLLGMPFYLLMYFHFKKQMQVEMNRIA